MLTRTNIAFFFLLCGQLIIDVRVPVVAAQDTPDEQLKKSLPAIVAIEARLSDHSTRRGVGVIIDASGVIVTNAHIVEAAQHIRVKFSDKTSANAGIIALFSDDDVAFLHFAGHRTSDFIIFPDKNTIRLGVDAYFLGSSVPFGEEVIKGAITGIGRFAQTNNDDRQADLIQLDFGTRHGDSGGPVFDSEGKLLGIIMANRKSVTGATLAVPVYKIAERYLELKATKTK